MTWGTPASPEITLADGDVTLEGIGTGAGLLVVKGELDYIGAFTYTGLIFVLGGDITMSGANKTIIGGTFIADVIENGNGTYHYGPLRLSLMETAISCIVPRDLPWLTIFFL